MLDCKYILITQLSSWFLGATTARAGKGRKGNVRQRRKNKRFEGHKQISDGSFAFVVFPSAPLSLSHHYKSYFPLLIKGRAGDNK